MSETAVAINDVTFAWPGDGGFSLEVPDLQITGGSRVLLFGPSGSGKSTLLSLLCGILTVDQGQLQVLGTELKSLSGHGRDRFRAEHAGVVFQQFNLLPYASLTDNVVLPLSFAPVRRQRAVERLGSAEAEAARLLAELGLDQLPPSTRAANLSIGQQQRVAVARALIGGPEIVIADEPTSALDKAAQGRFLDLLFAQIDATDATLVMVSHDERLSDRFGRIIQLDDIVRQTGGQANYEAAE